MSKDDLSQALAKMRADYAAHLPQAVAQMEDLWRRLVAAELPPSRLAELLRMVHSVTGSGTTFGLPSASQAARELEFYLDPFAQSSRLPGPAEQEKVSTLLAALKQAALQT